MAGPDEFEGADGQDLAEVFDETNITEDGADIATSDMQRDLLDVTAAEDDADADDVMAADAEDFDPDALDEAEYEEIVQREEDLDEPRSFAADDAARVLGEGESPSDLEASDQHEGVPTDEDEAGSPPLP